MFFLIMCFVQGYLISLKSGTGMLLGIASTFFYWFHANIAYPNELARKRFEIGITYFLGTMFIGFFLSVLLFK